MPLEIPGFLLVRNESLCHNKYYVWHKNTLPQLAIVSGVRLPPVRPSWIAPAVLLATLLPRKKYARFKYLSTPGSSRLG